MIELIIFLTRSTYLSKARFEAFWWGIIFALAALVGLAGAVGGGGLAGAGIGVLALLALAVGIASIYAGAKCRDPELTESMIKLMLVCFWVMVLLFVLLVIVTKGTAFFIGLGPFLGVYAASKARGEFDLGGEDDAMDDSGEPAERKGLSTGAIVAIVAAVVLVVLGIAAVITIPAFIKYQRKAKTVEAIDMLDKIYRGAVDYYSTPRVGYDGGKIECQFPADQVPTPSAGTCCADLGGPDRNGDGRCDVDADAWSTATWSALRFQMNDEHYFVYSFDSNGMTGPDAQFTVSAYADLDCDGIMSTFQRFGRADPRSMYGECSVASMAALFTQNETE